jgi:hypothetical protein
LTNRHSALLGSRDRPSAAGCSDSSLHTAADSCVLFVVALHIFIRCVCHNITPQNVKLN